MTSLEVSFTNCLICDKTLQSGTGILLFDVGHFCSQECFKRIPHHPTHKIITFGPAVFDEPPPIAPKPHSHPMSSVNSNFIQELQAKLGTQPTQRVASLVPVSTSPVITSPVITASVAHKLVPIVPTTDPNQARPNNVIVQRFPTDLLPPPQVRVYVPAPPPKATATSPPKHSDIPAEIGWCSFCEQSHTVTYQNLAGKKFCRVDLLNRYGDGYRHAMANTNPTYIPGFGTFNSHMRYAVPFLHIK
jgi:hypothetical protein